MGGGFKVDPHLKYWDPCCRDSQKGRLIVGDHTLYYTPYTMHYIVNMCICIYVDTCTIYLHIYIYIHIYIASLDP